MPRKTVAEAIAVHEVEHRWVKCTCREEWDAYIQYIRQDMANEWKYVEQKERDEVEEVIVENTPKKYPIIAKYYLEVRDPSGYCEHVLALDTLHRSDF